MQLLILAHPVYILSQLKYYYCTIKLQYEYKASS